ncbi:hypothetical protein Tco_0760315 [Tanacetum coccineum]
MIRRSKWLRNERSCKSFDSFEEEPRHHMWNRRWVCLRIVWERNRNDDVEKDIENWSNNIPLKIIADVNSIEQRSMAVNIPKFANDSSHCVSIYAPTTSGSGLARLHFRQLGGRIVGRIVVGKRCLGLVVVVVEKIGFAFDVAFYID